MTITPATRDAIMSYVAEAVASDKAIDVARASTAFADSYVDTLANDRDALHYLLTAETARRLKAQAKHVDPDQPQLWEMARTIAPGVIKRTDACTFAELESSHAIKAQNASNVNRALERDRRLLEHMRPVMEGTDLTVAQATAMFEQPAAA